MVNPGQEDDAAIQRTIEALSYFWVRGKFLWWWFSIIPTMHISHQKCVSSPEYFFRGIAHVGTEGNSKEKNVGIPLVHYVFET